MDIEERRLSNHRVTSPICAWQHAGVMLPGVRVSHSACQLARAGSFLAGSVRAAVRLISSLLSSTLTCYRLKLDNPPSLHSSFDTIHFLSHVTKCMEINTGSRRGCVYFTASQKLNFKSLLWGNNAPLICLEKE